jgi:cyclic lactone autoinducer peptide
MVKEKILRSIANATRKIAKSASSNASFYYSYQPKVPIVLKKN